MTDPSPPRKEDNPPTKPLFCPECREPVTNHTCMWDIEKGQAHSIFCGRQIPRSEFLADPACPQNQPAVMIRPNPVPGVDFWVDPKLLPKKPPSKDAELERVRSVLKKYVTGYHLDDGHGGYFADCSRSRCKEARAALKETQKEGT